ncbi:MAG: hypothetical protein R3E89_20095 [Thiolinea sp.]
MAAFNECDELQDLLGRQFSQIYQALKAYEFDEYMRGQPLGARTSAADRIGEGDAMTDASAATTTVQDYPAPGCPPSPAPFTDTSS